MASAIQPGPPFAAATMRFESDAYDFSGQAPAYDAARRPFVMLKRSDTAGSAPVNVMLDWMPEP